MDRIVKKAQSTKRISVFLGEDPEIRASVLKIPKGMRSSLTRALLHKLSRIHQRDPLIYGAVLNGTFDIEYKHLIDNSGDPVREHIRDNIESWLSEAESEEDET